MSDTGRKNFSDKISETVTPENNKSLDQKIKEGITDSYDSVASKLEPDSQKSVTQKAGDVISGAKKDTENASDSISDTAKNHSESFFQQAEDAIKSSLNSAGEYIHSASEYVQGKN